MKIKLFALRFKDLRESQAFDRLNENNGNLAYRLSFAIRDTLYYIFELAKRNLYVNRASLIIRSHICKELIRFQLKHACIEGSTAPR